MPGGSLQEGGAAAVKIEGGRPVVDVARRLVEVGIPVMGHLGLIPQSVHQLGGYGRQAERGKRMPSSLLQDAVELERAGVFSIVLESIPQSWRGGLPSRCRCPPSASAPDRIATDRCW